jgi:hypothetical protein
VIDRDEIDLRIGIAEVFLFVLGVSVVVVFVLLGLTAKARFVSSLRRRRPDVAASAGELAELLQLSLADDGGVLEMVSILRDARDGLVAERLHEPLELIHRRTEFVVVYVAGLYAYEDCAAQEVILNSPS